MESSSPILLSFCTASTGEKEREKGGSHRVGRFTCMCGKEWKGKRRGISRGILHALQARFAGGGKEEREEKGEKTLRNWSSSSFCVATGGRKISNHVVERGGEK